MWKEGLPSTERDLCLAGLGFFTFDVEPSVVAGRPTPEQAAALERGEVDALVQAGVLHPEPIVYEDFLPRSAAGIFASNLADGGTMDADQGGAERDADWMADAMGKRSTSPRSSTRRRHQPHSVRPSWPSVERSAPRGCVLIPDVYRPGR